MAPGSSDLNCATPAATHGSATRRKTAKALARWAFSSLSHSACAAARRAARSPARTLRRFGTRQMLGVRAQARSWHQAGSNKPEHHCAHGESGATPPPLGGTVACRQLGGTKNRPAAVVRRRRECFLSGSSGAARSPHSSRLSSATVEIAAPGLFWAGRAREAPEAGRACCGRLRLGR